MINLLPPKEKENILLIQKEKITVIFWFFILFFLTNLCLVLFPVKLYIQSQVRYQDIVLSGIKSQFETSGVGDIQEEISSINLNLVKLNNFYQNRVSLGEVFEKISSLLPQGAYLTGFNVSPFNVEQKTVLKIDISGFVKNREILFGFKENIEKESSFDEINFPPSNWIKSNDIDFYVTFKTK